MAGRSIPDAMKAQLAETGIPVAPRRIEHVTTPREAASSLLASVGPLHRLLGSPTSVPRLSGPRSVSNRGSARPLRPAGRRGALRQLGDRPWPDTLHHYGVQVANWAPLGEPDGSEEYLSPVEGEPALGELGRPS